MSLIFERLVSVYSLSSVRTIVVLVWFSVSVCTDSIPSASSILESLGVPKDLYEEHDLIRAIAIPFDNPKTQFFEEGADGFPAFGFKPGSDVKSPYRLFFPERLYAEFSILVMVKPNSRAGGFIFSVVNPLETVVQLGVQLSPSGVDTNISLLYTDVPAHFSSKTIASFAVSDFVGKWTKFAFKVTAENVTLYYNCREYDTVTVRRQPQELVFDSASTLYIAQAGPIIKGPFDGAIQELKLFGSPGQAEVQCDTFEGFESGEGPQSDFDIDDVDRDDGGGLFGGEGSGREEIPPFPPPPPGPDGKNCPPCDESDCCKYILNKIPMSDAAGKGLKGDKGDRGPRGPPGESIRGPPGPPGAPGQPGLLQGPTGSVVGPPGPPGVCSCNMSTLMSSFVMPDLIPGAPGAPGAEGKMGPPGITGMPGAPGERGAIGPKGEKGERGDTGAQGPEGLQGPKGEAGRDGMAGQIGPPGPPGPPGPVEFENFDDALGGAGLARPGAPGNKGEPGALGQPGPRGERGLQGAKGDRGEAGLKGERGERGYAGERGSQGPKGEPGSAGLDGLPGIPGANGRPAEKGEKGEPGKQGLPGPPGVPVYSLNADEAKSVAGQPGTKGEPGDRGTKGEKGDRGDAGPGGIPGMNGAAGPAGEKGEPGIDGIPGPAGQPGTKGERGDRGPPGPVTITESGAQVLSVKGDKGDPGKRGRRGKPGPAGPPGAPGKPGPSGEIGLPGWMGRPGMSGLPGIPGFKGEKGEPGSGDGYGIGEKGEKGDRGDRGRDGTAGRDGNPGPPGPASSEESIRYVPVPGPPGPPGLPGAPGLSITGPKGEPGESALPAYGERVYTSRNTGVRSSLEELKALKELKELKELKPTTERPIPAEEGLIAKIVPGAVTFQDKEAMTKMSGVSPVGTLAYVIEEEALLVRVNNGWQYIALGSLLPITTPAPPTTSSSIIRPPFEASNLINNIPQPVEGPSLRMAALNEPHTGDTHGLRGADYACYREARRAGLRGTFRAFLSSRVQNVDSIVRAVDRELPVVNLRGEVLFHSWADMFRGDGAPFPHPPRILSFNGKNVLTDISWPHKAVWHGALADGQRALDISCDAWHSGAYDKLGLAGSLRGPRLLEQNPFTCDKKLILLCIEVTSEHGSIQRRKRSFNDSFLDEDGELLTEANYSLLLENIAREN